MNIIVTNKCNLFITLIQVLDFCANERMSESAILNSEAIYKDLEKLATVIRKSSYINDINLFFKFYTIGNMNYHQLPLSVSKYLSNSSTNFYDKDFSEIIKDIKNCSLNDFLPWILLDLQNTIINDGSVEDSILSMNEDDMKNQIKQSLKLSSISNELKWSFFCLIDDFDDMKARYCNLLIKCYEDFNFQLVKLSKKLDKWCDYLDSKISSEGIEFIEDMLYSSSLNDFDTIHIYGNLLIYYACILKDPGDGDLYIGLGINVDKHLMEIRGITNMDWFINSTKILLDQSKFNILKLLSNRPMYGSELAEALSLTTATISHHISALREADFIKEEVSSNRVFCDLNKESLEKWVEIFQSELKLKK